MRIQGTEQSSLLTRVRACARDPEDAALMAQFLQYHEAMMDPSNTVQDKLRVWFETYPGRRCTHERLGQEIGATREVICRELQKRIN